MAATLGKPSIYSRSNLPPTASMPCKCCFFLTLYSDSPREWGNYPLLTAGRSIGTAPPPRPPIRHIGHCRDSLAYPWAEIKSVTTLLLHVMTKQISWRDSGLPRSHLYTDSRGTSLPGDKIILWFSVIRREYWGEYPTHHHGYCWWGNKRLWRYNQYVV